MLDYYCGDNMKKLFNKRKNKTINKNIDISKIFIFQIIAVGLGVILIAVVGIEVFSSYHNNEDVKRYLEVAKEMNCFVSVGSSYINENHSIVIGESKAIEKYEKVIRVLVDRCLKMVEKKD